MSEYQGYYDKLLCVSRTNLLRKFGRMCGKEKKQEILYIISTREMFLSPTLYEKKVLGQHVLLMKIQLGKISGIHQHTLDEERKPSRNLSCMLHNLLRFFGFLSFNIFPRCLFKVCLITGQSQRKITTTIAEAVTTKQLE